MAQPQFVAETAPGGQFVRQHNRFTGRVAAESTSPPGGGPDERGRWPLEAGRHLFQTPGFGETVDFDHIKRHGTHLAINPTGIVPAGPDLSGWTTPHGRG